MLAGSSIGHIVFGRRTCVVDMRLIVRDVVQKFKFLVDRRIEKNRGTHSTFNFRTVEFV